MKVLIIPEDFRKDQYMLKLLIKVAPPLLRAQVSPPSPAVSGPLPLVSMCLIPDSAYALRGGQLAPRSWRSQAAIRQGDTVQ